MIKKYLTFLISSVLFLSSCKAKTDKKLSAEEMYLVAMQKLDKGDYDEAKKKLDQIQIDYPFSSLTKEALTISIFINYKSKSYAEVVASTEQFTKLYPTYKNLDYILYLRSLSYFDQIKDLRKNKDNMLSTKKSIVEVLLRYPGTKYKEDLEKRLDLTEQYLLASTIDNVNFYLDNQAYVSALIYLKELINASGYKDGEKAKAISKDILSKMTVIN